MGAFNFELLESADIPTHYRGVVERDAADGEVVALEAVDEPPVEMAIDLTQVPELPNEGREYDYDHYHDAAGENYLIPLEIVFRNRVPEVEPSPTHRAGRSRTRARRLAGGSRRSGGADRRVLHGEDDLERAEADSIAGLADVDDLESLAREVNRVITEQAESAGLDHQDGKIECLYVDGEIRVADVVGTFDENRFSYEGTQLSKSSGSITSARNRSGSSPSKRRKPKPNAKASPTGEPSVRPTPTHSRTPF